MAEETQKSIVVVIPLQNVLKLRSQLVEQRENTHQIHIASKAKEAIENLLDVFIEALPTAKEIKEHAEKKVAAKSSGPTAAPIAAISPPNAPASAPKASVHSQQPPRAAVTVVEGEVTADQALAALAKVGMQAEITEPTGSSA